MRTNLEIGQAYGKWIVEGFDCVDLRRRCRYFCKCECGKIESVQAAALKAGRTKSCPQCRQENIAGLRFGRWTVLNKSDNSHKRKRSTWLCRCDCGQESDVLGNNLLRGISEGCWICQREVIKCDLFPRAWYRKFIEQAKLRNRKWKVSEQYLWDLWQKQEEKCALSGLPISLNKGNITASIDRINNSLDYVEGNVQFLHKIVNTMKYKYDQDAFVQMCKNVAFHN